MSISRLVEFFSTFTRLPVYAEDVRDQLVEMDIQDNILLREMDVPPGKLLGMFVRFKMRNALYGQEVTKSSVVFYNKNVDPMTQNLICIKELMHVFDDQIKAATHTKEELRQLIDDLFADKDFVAPFDVHLGSFIDELAVAVAVAILFPHEIRDDFIRAHQQGRMTHEDIANECGLPSKFVPALLSQKWEVQRAFLLRIS
jgi:Zn-dependent peptidase ImmA (M78 family)